MTCLNFTNMFLDGAKWDIISETGEEGIGRRIVKVLAVKEVTVGSAEREALSGSRLCSSGILKLVLFALLIFMTLAHKLKE